MSLDKLWSKAASKMPPKNTTKKKDVQPTTPPRVGDPKLAGGASPPSTNVSREADPGLTGALEVMTANIAQMMDEKLDKMALDIKANISQSLREVTERVGEAEQRILVMEDASADTGKRLLSLEKTVNELTERLQDYENRSRRKNLRIIGLPEKLEGTNTTTFMETWIPEILQLDTKSGRIKLERAHRLQGPETSRFPRAIIARFHNFSDRQRVMDAARRLKDIRVEGTRIHFFPDFAAATQRKRREFDQVRRRLQNIEGARYAMIYPASLKIMVNNTAKMFHSPEQASLFVDSL